VSETSPLSFGRSSFGRLSFGRLSFGRYVFRQIVAEPFIVDEEIDKPILRKKVKIFSFIISLSVEASSSSRNNNEEYVKGKLNHRYRICQTMTSSNSFFSKGTTNKTNGQWSSSGPVNQRTHFLLTPMYFLLHFQLSAPMLTLIFCSNVTFSAPMLR
jgi:hypothetical protein